MVIHFLILITANHQPFKLPLKRKMSPQIDSPAPSDHFGLRILVDPPDASTPINIIFVHGLGGSAEGTWTDDSQRKSLWPLWLPKVKGLENARIMTFGYDSGWNKIWKPNNVLDISDFGKQLVHELWCHYAEYGDV
jgi:hypothetical protein